MKVEQSSCTIVGHSISRRRSTVYSVERKGSRQEEPDALTPKEMAFLVVMIPGPVKYQRSFHEGALSAGLEPLVVNLLAKLRSVDALSEDEYQAALAETLAFRRPDALPSAEP